MNSLRTRRLGLVTNTLLSLITAAFLSCTDDDKPTNPSNGECESPSEEIEYIPQPPLYPPTHGELGGEVFQQAYPNTAVAFISDSVRKKAAFDLRLLRYYGGKFERNPGSNCINYFIDQRDNVVVNIHYTNLPMDLEDVEAELASRAKTYLEDSFELSHLRDVYDSIEQTGDIEIEVNIGGPDHILYGQQVEYRVTYPLRVRYGTESFSVDEFPVILDDDFYVSYVVAERGIDSIVTTGNPDCSLLTEFSEYFGRTGGLGRGGCYEDRIPTDEAFYRFAIRTQEDINRGRRPFSFVAGTHE
jgi:hypothetical protein